MSSLVMSRPKALEGDRAPAATPAHAHAMSIQKPASPRALLSPKHRGSPTTGDTVTPFNTPANHALPIPAALQRPATKAHNPRPISAMKGRGIVPANHAATPGNTMNSVEMIGKRMADNLLLGGPPPQHNNVIAPSYERRFIAGLSDIGRRLAQDSPNPLTIKTCDTSPTANIQPDYLSVDNSARRETLSSPSTTNFSQAWPETFSNRSSTSPVDEDKARGRG